MATPAPTTTETATSALKGFASFAQGKLLENLPTIVETGKQQVINASLAAMKKMTPDQVKLFSTNLNEINSAVQAAAVPQATGSSRKSKKRTLKLKQKRRY
jgi:hypothetical protein